jgi:hypothetical protein
VAAPDLDRFAKRPFGVHGAPPYEKVTMKSLTALAFLLMSLLAIAATACSQPNGDYYENDKHGGYPGPGTLSPEDGT